MRALSKGSLLIGASERCTHKTKRTAGCSDISGNGATRVSATRTKRTIKSAVEKPNAAWTPPNRPQQRKTAHRFQTSNDNSTKQITAGRVHKARSQRHPPQARAARAPTAPSLSELLPSPRRLVLVGALPPPQASARPRTTWLLSVVVGRQRSSPLRRSRPRRFVFRRRHQARGRPIPPSLAAPPVPPRLPPPS